MKALIVFAYPEQQSFNGALKDTAVNTLAAAGHAVQVSDLYRMGWKASLTRVIFPVSASVPVSFTHRRSKSRWKPQRVPRPTFALNRKKCSDAT